MHPHGRPQGQVSKKHIFLSWLLSLHANRSISGVPNMSIILRNTPGLSCHSILSLNCLELLSVSKLRTPGKWHAVNQISFCTQHIQTLLASLLHRGDVVPPPPPCIEVADSRRVVTFYAHMFPLQ